MGDRASKQKASEDIYSLIDNGINHGELRDEIYCQLVKQLTRNPRMYSLRDKLVLTYLAVKVFVKDGKLWPFF